MFLALGRRAKQTQVHKFVFVCNVNCGFFFLGEGFAEEMRSARKLGTLKQYIVGRSSEATFAEAFEKQEAIIRYLGGFDPTGEVDSLPLYTSQLCLEACILNRNICTYVIPKPRQVYIITA